MQLESWLAFCSIAFIATVTPGPAVLLVTTHSLQQGVARSLFTIAGNVSGLFTMSAGSVLGLSALVIYSTTAFMTLKVLGAAYLIFMGVKLWRGGTQSETARSLGGKPANAWSLYTQGLLIALTNPKAIVFTTALFPQFIVISEPLLPQFAILVSTFMSFSFLCLFAYACLGQHAKRRARPILSATTVGRLFGSTFIGAGAALAVSSQR